MMARVVQFDVLFFLLLLSGAVGCGSKPVVVAEKDNSQDHLIKIVAAYLQAAEHLKRGPRTLDELRPYLKQVEAEETVLRSPHDHEPYVIHWGVDVLSEATAAAPQILIYEKRGKNGKRWVATTLRTTYQLTETEFRQAVFPRGHKPPA